MGTSSDSRRLVEIEMNFPANSGSLKNLGEAWVDRVERQVPEVPANSAVACDEAVRIAGEASSYKRVKIQVVLYISVPRQEQTSQDDHTVELQAIQQTDLEFQLASHHKFDPVSKFLLVTNPDTTRGRVQAIQDFVNHKLSMQLDEWKLGLYGGF